MSPATKADPSCRLMVFEPMVLMLIVGVADVLAPDALNQKTMPDDRALGAPLEVEPVIASTVPATVLRYSCW